MQLLLKGRPKTALTPELEAYAREKFSRLAKFLPDPATVEVVLADERGVKGGIDRAVRVTITKPHEKHPIHLEEITADFRTSIDLVAARTSRTLRKIREKRIDFHRRILGRSQRILSETARQTAAIPGWVWKTVRRQLLRRGW